MIDQLWRYNQLLELQKSSKPMSHMACIWASLRFSIIPMKPIEDNLVWNLPLVLCLYVVSFLHNLCIRLLDIKPFISFLFWNIFWLSSCQTEMCPCFAVVGLSLTPFPSLLTLALAHFFDLTLIYFVLGFEYALYYTHNISNTNIFLTCKTFYFSHIVYMHI